MKKGVIQEFKEFAARGNVVDMAVGIVIGAGFAKIVSSMVSDVLMPPVGLLMGHVNFADLFINLEPSKGEFASLAQAKQAGAAVIAYGAFLSAIIDFVIVAFCIFLLIKAVNAVKRKQAPAAESAAVKECPYCFSMISIKATRCPNCTSEVRLYWSGTEQPRVLESSLRS